MLNDLTLHDQACFNIKLNLNASRIYDGRTKMDPFFSKKVFLTKENYEPNIENYAMKPTFLSRLPHLVQL